MLEKSLKHKGQPLLTYLNSGALKESNALTGSVTSAQCNTDSVHASMDLAFRQLESRLLPSIQEVITSSIGSLKASIELEIRLLHTKVDELTKRVQQFEGEISNSQRIDA